MNTIVTMFSRWYWVLTNADYMKNKSDYMKIKLPVNRDIDKNIILIALVVSHCCP